ncbi:MAG: ATP-binding cassette domain-containing protein [Alphaproteobacteria bacterium]|nr:ATP-binding cassette domain-containing protein [Alphaproteobacteria bacterium]
MAASAQSPPLIAVENLAVGFAGRVLERDVAFEIPAGVIFVVMGRSGCGKSTLLRHMTGLLRPPRGDVRYDGRPFWASDDASRDRLRHRFGVVFQNGALWSSMTVAENVALPLTEFTRARRAEIDAIVALKLALVGLNGAGSRYPNELSGGMRKRAGLARAMALDPDILFLDEPSAGLDPISAKQLDDLILQLRDSLGATIVVVTHELTSILTIGDDSIFLDAEAQAAIAHGNPRQLLRDCENPIVREFLTRDATREPVPAARD